MDGGGGCKEDGDWELVERDGGDDGMMLLTAPQMRDGAGEERFGRLALVEVDVMASCVRALFGSIDVARDDQMIRVRFLRLFLDSKFFMQRRYKSVCTATNVKRSVVRCMVTPLVKTHAIWLRIS